MRSKVMVAGHICLDITPKFSPDSKGGFSDIFCPGKLVNVEEAVLSTGGAVSNTGLTMAKLGLDVLLNGKVGKDEFGQVIMTLVGEKMASSFSVVNGQSSSYTIVLALPGIDRVFLHHTGTNDTFTSDDVDYAALEGCEIFHFGYPPLMKQMYSNGGAELVRMYQKAKQKNVITSLDMTLPDPDSDSGKLNWKEILTRFLPYVDVFLPSAEEIAFMLEPELFARRKAESGGDDPVLNYSAEDCQRLGDRLISMGVKIAAIKCGINGYYLQTAGKDALADLSDKIDVDNWASRQMWAPSYKAIKFGSATGAGDATIAGFLTAIVQGLGPVEAIKVANTLGWQNVRQVDPLSGIESWKMTLDMINDDSRELNPLAVEGAGWRFCNSDQVYFGPCDKEKKERCDHERIR